MMSCQWLFLELKQMHANFVNSTLKTDTTNRSDKKLAMQMKQQNTLGYYYLHVTMAGLVNLLEDHTVWL